MQRAIAAHERHARMKLERVASRGVTDLVIPAQAPAGQAALEADERRKGRLCELRGDLLRDDRPEMAVKRDAIGLDTTEQPASPPRAGGDLHIPVLLVARIVSGSAIPNHRA
jgi:hypothetical protein